MTRPVHPAYVVSADWSKHARKRSVYIADLQQRRIRRAEGHAWHLASLLTLATDLARHGSVLVGIDLALGVPRDYWRRVRDGRRRRQPVTFLDWLCELDPTSGFFQTTDDPHRWRVERPWFAVPPGHGGLRSFTAQAGDGFRRRLDHATQAKPLFAVSGMPGTVGSGTRDFWKALIPVLARKRDFAIWPFEGELPDLFATQQIVLAETYPALAYAVALATDLPTHRVRVAKTHHAARDRVCGHLAQMPWVVANGVDLGDLGPTRTNEDDFDAHLTAAAILRCVLEGTPVTRSEWIDAEAEGSMLLAGPVDLHKGAVNLLSRVRGSAHATLVPACHCWGRNAWCVRRIPATPTSTHAVQQRGVSLSDSGMYESVSGLTRWMGCARRLVPHASSVAPGCRGSRATKAPLQAAVRRLVPDGSHIVTVRPCGPSSRRDPPQGKPAGGSSRWGGSGRGPTIVDSGVDASPARASSSARTRD